MATTGSDPNEEPAERKSIRDLYGMLEYDGPPVSVEEMDEAIAATAVERYQRSFDD